MTETEAYLGVNPVEAEERAPEPSPRPGPGRPKGPPITEAIREERAAAEPKPEWPKARQIRWALLHGEALSTPEAMARWGVVSSGLSVVMGDLKAAGFIIVKSPGTNPPGVRGRAPSQFRLTNPDHEPIPRSARSARVAKRKAKATRTQPRSRSVSTATPTPVPSAPALGTTPRVVMVAEDAGDIVIVLQGSDGARYFARIEENAP